jgi:hypothetical protein
MRELRDLVAQLTATINNVSLHTSPQHARTERRRSRSPTRRSSSPFHDRERTTTDPGPRSIFCWYHTKFGASAKKCSPPCSFSQQTSSPFVMENLFPNIIPWYQKLKTTLHPDNVQMVTARIQACKLYWSRYN